MAAPPSLQHPSSARRTTSGDAPPRAELTKLFFRELRVLGSTVGTRDELRELLDFLVVNQIEPIIDLELPLSRARQGFERLAAGKVFGKVIFTG